MVKALITDSKSYMGTSQAVFMADKRHMADALQAVERINSSVSKNDIKRHEVWLKEFGSV